MYSIIRDDYKGGAIEEPSGRNGFSSSSAPRTTATGGGQPARWNGTMPKSSSNASRRRDGD